MAMKITEKSKKNPQEYIPYLNNLKKMDPEYLKYKIDCQFKKYDSALKNISQSLSEEHFKEALLLIENHKLYSLALRLYKPYPERKMQQKRNFMLMKF
ncbi:elongator complex protein 1-like [Lycorma delicatula]|uniref:elongator complex protein 1-like n=1 Tax=Lycorma delicatula TaxID=130591 RepID=UPI003F511CF7